MEVSVRGGMNSSRMKGAQSTSSIPTFRGYTTSSKLGSDKGHLTVMASVSVSVCSGLNQSDTSFSKKGNSSSRPSSIPKLIPLTNSQKKGYLLRSILARNAKDAPSHEVKRVNDYPGPNDKETQGASKRLRLAHPSGSATSLSLARNSSFREGGNTPSRIPRASEIQRNQESNTSLLREQIKTFFGTTDGKPSKLKPVTPACLYFDPIQLTIDPYTMDILTRELENEALNYQLTCTKQLESQLTKRTETVSWIRKAGRALKLTNPTFHTATYIVDAFLRVQLVPYYSLELFGAAALFIAAKQEETDCTLSSVTILKNCSLGLTPTRLTNMEAKILNKLKFKICVPTSLFFMEACASQMTYSDHFFKEFCHQLAQRILFDSLWENEMIFLPNSKKARLALHYVVKYVSYNYDLLRLVHEKDTGIWDKFKMKCYPEFRSACLAGVAVPGRMSVVDPTSQVLKDLTNKGCRQVQTRDTSSTYYTSIRSTRSSRVK